MNRGPGALRLVGSAADCLALRTTAEGRACWHDRRTGSAVVPITWVQQLRQVRVLQQQAVEQGRTLALDAWNSPRAQRLRARANGAPGDDTTP